MVGSLTRPRHGEALQVCVRGARSAARAVAERACGVQDRAAAHAAGAAGLPMLGPAPRRSSWDSRRAGGSTRRCRGAQPREGEGGMLRQLARSAPVTHAGLHACGCDTASPPAQCATDTGLECPAAAASLQRSSVGRVSGSGVGACFGDSGWAVPDRRRQALAWPDMREHLGRRGGCRHAVPLTCRLWRRCLPRLQGEAHRPHAW